MEIKLTLAQFEKLQQLCQIVEAAIIRGATEGEAINCTDKAEWEADEVKITLN